jgi:glycosyltransferase involved in cell wall biosynthesis
MIVKNESKIIERCIRSCLPLIDAISICDTGSTDNTISIIETLVEKEKESRPLECQIVTEHKWVNFGHNRTLSAQEARKFLIKLGWQLDDTYLLLVDADMCIVLDQGKEKVVVDLGLSCQGNESISLLQKGGNIEYDNVRLLVATHEWKCVGVTHEYWDTRFGYKRIESMYINDIGDGGAKNDKFDRDIRLLTEDLERNPKNARSIFYLAQSYRCRNADSSDLLNAIHWYKLRTQMNDHVGEIWYSYYMIAECCRLLNMNAEMIEWYLKAYNYDQSRAESLYRLANWYRNQPSSQPLGYMFALLASNIPFPKMGTGNTLFVERDVYSYKCLHEIAICAFYHKSDEARNEGIRAVDKFILDRDTEWMKAWGKQTLIFYVRPLPADMFITNLKHIQIRLPELSNGAGFYNPMNPSIVHADNNGYFVICRTVNYKLVNHRYIFMEGNNKINTKNVMIRLDNDLREDPSYRFDIVDCVGQEMKSDVGGLEDMRMFLYRDRYWAFGGNHITVDMPQIVLVDLGTPQEWKEKGRVEIHRKVLLEFAENRCEKNWMPVVIKDSLFALYSHEPQILLKIDIDQIPEQPGLHVYPRKFVNGQNSISTKFEDYNLDILRGSCPPVLLKHLDEEDEYISIVHEVIIGHDRGRVYLHRFISYDMEMKVKSISLPFYFKQKGIEYVAGMTLSHDKSQLIITMGIDDSQAFICSVDVQKAKSLASQKYLYD